MLKNYLVIAFRNFLKNKVFSLINLMGLVISLTAFLLILIYIQYELSFDRYHKDYTSIYRVRTISEMNGREESWLQTPAPLALFIKEKTPSIQNYVRIAKCNKVLINTEEKSFNETTLIVADPTIFDVFTFHLIIGDSNNVLNNPNSIVITESAAHKYFGNDNPIGKILSVNRKIDLVVTGMLKDIPTNSHLRFEFLASTQSADSLFWKGYLNDPLNTVVYTYLKINETSKITNQTIKTVEKFANSYYDVLPIRSAIKLQPISDIHLHSHYGGEFGMNSDIFYVYIFSIVAILVLLIACINYTNLSLAVYSTRIREVSIRKTFGSSRKQLTAMFLIESFIMLFLSLNFAFILIKLLLPWFTHVIDRPLAVELGNSNFYWIVILLVPFIAMLSGGYPTIYITRFKATTILKSPFLTNNNKFGVRQMLVFIQFVLSIALIIASIVILRQVNYLINKNLGFSKNDCVLVDISDLNVSNKSEIYKQELLQNPKILSATAISDIPGEMKWVASIEYEGLSVEELKNPPTMTYLKVDNDFIKAFKLKLIDGKDFSKKTTDIGVHEYILNESAVKSLGWENPIGKHFGYFQDQKGKVIGVVNDFHFKSLHTKIEPLFLSVDSKNFSYLSIRINNENFRETLTFIQNKWKTLANGRPFEYYLLDHYLNKLYKPEILLGRVILIFSFLTILITCLGLFGLTSFIVFRRTKEIGIRKVNGATVKSILLLLSKDFTRWVMMAFIIACPITYYIMNRWLQNFAYKTELNWWIFALAGLIVFTIALITVVWQSRRTASRNPIEALRYE